MSQAAKQGIDTRILLVQNGLYIPTHGGANKVNRALMEGLAANNHICQAVVRAQCSQDSSSPVPLLKELLTRGIKPVRITRDTVMFELNRVEIHAVTDGSKLRQRVIEQREQFQPDWTLVASEDPGQVLLATCLPRAIYLAQTTLMLPFGPGAFTSFDHGRIQIGRAAGVVTFSKYLQTYMREWGGLDSTVISPPIFGDGPFPRLGRFAGGYVTIVNPCAIKGIDIFHQLAEALPQTEFAAVRGWGTTRADREALMRLPNVRLLDPVDDIRDILKETRVLLVPSLCAEAFGCIAVEAMLHRIPVLASNVGGLPEAKLGVDYVLPVRPIQRYQMRFDDRLLPIPITPVQDCRPWLAALTDMVSSETRYNAIADESYTAAKRAGFEGGITTFGNFLETLGNRTASYVR